MIHHVADAGWSVGLRRVFENINRAIIPLAVLFVPVLIGIFSGKLHAWYDFVHGPEPTEGHLKHLWHVKHAYFARRSSSRGIAIYFAVWIALLGRDAELVHEAGRGRRGGAHARRCSGGHRRASRCSA